MVNSFLGTIFLSRLLNSNFEYVANVPGASSVLLLMTMIGLLVLSVWSFSRPGSKITDHQTQWSNALKWLGIGSALCAVLINEFTIPRYLSLDGVLEPSTIFTVRTVQAILLISGITLLILRHVISPGLARLAIPPQLDVQDAHHSEKAGLLPISLIVPWVILLSTVEADRLERFWWLWPLQVLIFASVVTYLPLQLRLPRPLIWIGSLILVFLVAGNPLLLSRVNAWSRDGWSGSDAEEIKVVDYTASLIRSERKDRAAIGYHTSIDRSAASWRLIM